MISENMIKVNQNLLMKYQNKLKRMRGKGQVHYFHILSATMNTISAGQEDVSERKPLIRKSGDHSNELKIGCSPEEEEEAGFWSGG